MSFQQNLEGKWQIDREYIREILRENDEQQGLKTVRMVQGNMKCK